MYPQRYTVWSVILSTVLLLGSWTAGEAARKSKQHEQSGQHEQRGLQTVTPEETRTLEAERRIALVIGNAAYAEGALKNPVNDANDIAAALKVRGFEVITLTNATIRQMHEATEEFSRKLRRSDVGLFYYAGHGLQVNGENYLVPIGARISREQDVQFETYNVGRLLGVMEDAGNAMNLILLDACRNNPFTRSFRSAPAGGLAAQLAAPGSLIAYATAPGSVAADGVGRNGVYTRHLLERMKTPGLPVEEMFKQVRISVRQETGQKQTPWESSSLTRSFSFTPSTGVTPQPQPIIIAEPRPQPPVQAPVAALQPPQLAPSTPPPQRPLPAPASERPTTQSTAVLASLPTQGALVNSLHMEFVLIPPGEFTMGAEGSNGIPAHRVTITRPFYLARHEVTQGQWVEIMGHNPSAFKGDQHISRLGKEIKLDPNRPVDSVSWKEAQEFIQKLNAQEGHTKYRLPTEAEWEYAARAGMSTSPYSGTLDQYAWCATNAKGTTHPVGQLQPNSWGLHDMAGNVWEWVDDWWAAYKHESLIDPRGPASGVLKIFRGGAWNQGPAACQPAHRLYDAPTFKFPSVGFRLAREAQ